MSFPAYEEYKDSGVEWLGEVPEAWSCTAMTRIAERVVVGIAEAATHAYADDGIPILRSTNIRAGRIRGEILYVDPTFADERESKRIYAGDLVTVRTGNAGVTAQIPDELDGCQCFTMLITTLQKDQLPAFYCYWMNSVSAQCYFTLEGWGTAQVNISVPILKALPMPVPPLPEQTAIASFLDTETSKIDSLISEQRRLIELLKEKRDALARRASLLPETKHLRLGVVADQMERQIERMDDEEYTPIGMYNRGRGIFQKETTLGADLGDSTFFRIAEDDFILSGQFAWEGAVALATEAENGCVASHRYPVFRGKPDVVDSAYLLAFFETPRGQLLLDLHSRGAAGRNRPLNARTLVKEKIPVPPLDVQQRIAAIVRKETPFRETAERAIELLQERRTALISAAVTGKIDVREFATEAA